MLFIVNSSNFYFSVDESVQLDLSLLNDFGLKAFDCNESMYSYVCEKLNLDMDEVHSTEPLITKKGNALIHVCDRGFPSEIDDPDIYNYLSNYIL
jgi:hypothetical protein